MTPANKKIVGFGLIVLLIIVLVYLNKDKPAIKKVTDKVVKPSTAPATTPAAQTTDTAFNVGDLPPVKDDNFPLHDGSKGERVKTLQLALNRINENTGSKFTPLVVDGNFGPKTYTAIVTWVGTRYWEKTGLTENNYNQIFAISNKQTPAAEQTPNYSPVFGWGVMGL